MRPSQCAIMPCQVGVTFSLIVALLGMDLEGITKPLVQALDT